MLQYPIHTPATAKHADNIQNVTMHIVPMFLERLLSSLFSKILSSVKFL